MVDGRGVAAVADVLDARDGAAFVHVGDRWDADLGYVTGVDGGARESAYVQTAGGERYYCPPPGRADVAFDGTVVSAGEFDARAAGERAAAVLDGDGGTVLVPRAIPHDAAVYLERAGFDVASTDALDRARAVKTPSERERLRAVQSAASAGLDRARAVLGAATPTGDGLRYEGDPLTAERLRRAVNAALAGAGVDPAENTVVAGASGRGDARLTAGEPVVVDVAPRGRAGYHGRLARTVVADTDGGWERRAHLAATSALDVGVAELAAGTPVRRAREEALAELVAYGFDDGAASVHGIGRSPREAPAGGSDAPLEAGQVIALAPGVTDPVEGTVRVADAAVVTADGAEFLADHATGLAPTR
ncbi:MAG: M24 family metallopeptidase [Halarchaeum sp.]